MDFTLTIKEENNKIEVVSNLPYEKDRTVTLEENEAQEKLILSKGRITGVLPPVVRYISRSGRHILLERPPQVVKFNYYGKMKNDIGNATLQEYDLPLPWTQYAIGLDQLYRPYFTYLFASPTSINSRDDILYTLPLPNCEPSGKFCTPAPEWGGNDGEPWSIAEGINTAYAMLWNSNFNTDITSNISIAYRSRQPSAIFLGKGDRPEMAANARPKPSNLYKRWEEFTLEDVGRWIDWIPASWPDVSPLCVAHVIGFLQVSEESVNSGYMYNSIRSRVLM